MCSFSIYTFLKLLSIPILIHFGRITTSHKIPTLFANLPNTDTHPNEFYNQDQGSSLVPENQYYKPTSDFYYGTQPSPSNFQKTQNTQTDQVSHNEDNLKDANQANHQEISQQNEVSKQDLSKAAFELQEKEKSLEESKDKLKELESKEKELSDKLVDTNYEKLTQLVKERNKLINKISALGKTLRREHDSLYPDLSDQPVIIIAKSKEDEKRKANQLAHLEGFEDFMNHITSPCNMMEELREKSTESKKSNFREKFETEQKILDSMSLEKRLNYDRNMIEHYESIMKEIEEGIANAEDEINKSWNHFEE